MNNVHSKNRWQKTFFQSFGIKDQWYSRGLISSGCDLHAQRAQHALDAACYVPRFLTSQASGQPRPAAHSHKVCCCSCKIIHAMDMIRHVVPVVFYGFIFGFLDSQSMTFRVLVLQEIPCGLVCLMLRRSKISSQENVFWEVIYAQGKTLCCSTRLYTCRFMVPSSTTSLLLPPSDILPIRRELVRCYHLFPAHRHECASHPVAYAPQILHLCDITWTSTRLWRYRVAYFQNTMSSCPLTAASTMYISNSRALCQPARMISSARRRVMVPLIARFMGHHGAHLGPTGPRWSPCWPHEPCLLSGTHWQGTSSTRY